MSLFNKIIYPLRLHDEYVSMKKMKPCFAVWIVDQHFHAVGCPLCCELKVPCTEKYVCITDNVLWNLEGSCQRPRCQCTFCTMECERVFLPYHHNTFEAFSHTFLNVFLFSFPNYLKLIVFYIGTKTRQVNY